MPVTALIPARGGSKGIHRKNLQPVRGLPLFLHAARQALYVTDDVVVSSDDLEILALAELHGFRIHQREEVDDQASIDDLVRTFPRDGWLLVVQPTVPELTDLEGFVDDALSGDQGMAMAVPHRHINWSAPDMPPRRLQRGEAGPWTWDEVGVRIYPPGVDRIDLLYPIEGPVTDIDTPEDLLTVRARMERKRILFRVRMSDRVGSGHWQRCRLIAERLQHHLVIFHFVEDEPDCPWPCWNREDIDVMPGAVDVIVNDTLDTTEADMLALRAIAPVLTLEDSGPGRQLANLSINALYEDGGRWAVLRPEFTSAPPYEVRREGTRILVTFGGTDPSGLTAKAIDAFSDMQTRIIRPPGWGASPVSMAAEMLWADVVVCSAGRTLYEAAHLGVPAVVMAQNPREETHRHLGTGCGNVFLGMGRMVDTNLLRSVTQSLLEDHRMREDLSVQARRVVDGRGLDRVVFEVERLARNL